MSNGQVDALLSLYQRVCGNLDLESQDAPTARIIARTIIEAALSGELDYDRLYRHAIRAALAA